MPSLILYDKITTTIKWKSNDSSSLAKQSSKLLLSYLLTLTGWCDMPEVKELLHVIIVSPTVLSLSFSNTFKKHNSA